jgi:hypothetical protein
LKKVGLKIGVDKVGEMGRIGEYGNSKIDDIEAAVGIASVCI